MISTALNRRASRSRWRPTASKSAAADDAIDQPATPMRDICTCRSKFVGVIGGAAKSLCWSPFRMLAPAILKNRNTHPDVERRHVWNERNRNPATEGCMHEMAGLVTAIRRRLVRIRPCTCSTPALHDPACGHAQLDTDDDGGQRRCPGGAGCADRVSGDDRFRGATGAGSRRHRSTLRAVMLPPTVPDQACRRSKPIGRVVGIGWLLLGFIFVAIGFVGVFVPLLPEGF